MKHNRILGLITCSIFFLKVALKGFGADGSDDDLKNPKCMRITEYR